MASKMLHSRPIKMWIDGKIFDIIQKNTNKLNKRQTEKSFEIYEGDNSKIDMEPLKQLEIQDDNGKFVTSFKLPSLYYIKIKNWPNFNIEKLSLETETQILVPKMGQDGELTVHSGNTKGLLEAMRHIHSALGDIREKCIPLQFVCIPCLSKSVRERFEHFKSEVLSMKDEIGGLHESVFISALKLHVTIDVYALLDDRERLEAVRALNEYKTELTCKGPMKLNISGLQPMNNNVKKVDVLYANVELVNKDYASTHTLQKIVNDIAEHFYNRGLARRYPNNVRIHMTVLNTKYRVNNSGENPKRRKSRRQSIDATKLLEKFGDYSFGECDFDSLHLSHMSAVGEDGFYKPLAVSRL